MLGETHLFAIPFLAAPAIALIIDDAGASPAATLVFHHGLLQIQAPIAYVSRQDVTARETPGIALA